MPGPFNAYSHLDELLARAMVAQQAMTEDQRIHERHAQRISFAAGNCAIDRPEIEMVRWTALVEKAAGPCPCGDCRLARNRADTKCEGWSL